MTDGAIKSREAIIGSLPPHKPLQSFTQAPKHSPSSLNALLVTLLAPFPGLLYVIISYEACTTVEVEEVKIRHTQSFCFDIIILELNTVVLC